MGGGGPPQSSQVVKEARAQAQALAKELQQAEEQRKKQEEEYKERLQDIEVLGEVNRQLQRQNDKLKESSEKSVNLPHLSAEVPMRRLGSTQSHLSSRS